MLLISCLWRRKGTLTHQEATLVAAALPSFPNPHQISTASISCLPRAFPTSFPQAPRAGSASAHERPPHASSLPAPPDESTFPRAPSEQAPQCASPREREPAPPPLASTDEATPPPLATARTLRRGRASAAACALPAPTSCASSLAPSRARGRPDDEAAPPPLATERTPRRGRASARGLRAACPDELRLFPGPLVSARLPPGCTADGTSSGCMAGGTSLRGLGFASSALCLRVGNERVNKEETRSSRANWMKH
jgi:hypothetical protein